MRKRLVAALLCVATTAVARAAPARATVAASTHPKAAAFVVNYNRTAPEGGYGWPLPGLPPVGRAFDPPESDYGPGHRGVDLMAPAGTSVRASSDGTVMFAASLAGRGVVSVLHADGLRTTYEPVTATVTAGSSIRKGASLGVLEPGHPGCPAVACLHWGARRGANRYLDPLRLLGRWAVRLLPWDRRNLSPAATGPWAQTRIGHPLPGDLRDSGAQS